MYENRSLISDWDTLRLVLAIDRHGGVAGAARALGVTHATVSRRLARAEGAAGIGFFERLPAGLRLTDPGRKILEHAHRVEPELHALERQLMSQEEGLSGPLRVTIPPLMMTPTFAASIKEFGLMHPKIQLEFVGDNNLLNLHQREADIAIRVTYKPPETLWGRKLTEQSAGYYAASDWLTTHPLAKGDLTGSVPLISFASWPGPVPRRLADLCPDIKIAARSDDMITAIRLVQSGLGITRMPRVIGDALQGVSRITALPWERYADIWCLTHPELRQVARVESFMRHIGTSMRTHRKLYKADAK